MTDRDSTAGRDRVKPVTAWAITYPMWGRNKDGYTAGLTNGTYLTRSDAIGRYTPQEWARMKRFGYRCIRVEIRPIEGVRR